MDKKQFRRSLMPIGLICLSGGLFFACLTHTPTFIVGFLVGFGVTLIVSSFLLGWYKPRKA